MPRFFFDHFQDDARITLGTGVFGDGDVARVSAFDVVGSIIKGQGTSGRVSSAPIEIGDADGNVVKAGPETQQGLD